MPHDIAILAPQGAASLARIKAVLGAAGVRSDGRRDVVRDGALPRRGRAIARRALADAGIETLAVREVLLVPRAQDPPGELGRLMQQLIDAGVQLDVQYGDHNHRKVFAVDDLTTASRALA